LPSFFKIILLRAIKAIYGVYGGFRGFSFFKINKKFHGKNKQIEFAGVIRRLNNRESWGD